MTSKSRAQSREIDLNKNSNKFEFPPLLTKIGFEQFALKQQTEKFEKLIKKTPLIFLTTKVHLLHKICWIHFELHFLYQCWTHALKILSCDLCKHKIASCYCSALDIFIKRPNFHTMVENKHHTLYFSTNMIEKWEVFETKRKP